MHFIDHSLTYSQDSVIFGTKTPQNSPFSNSTSSQSESLSSLLDSIIKNNVENGYKSGEIFRSERAFFLLPSFSVADGITVDSHRPTHSVLKCEKFENTVLDPSEINDIITDRLFGHQEEEQKEEKESLSFQPFNQKEDIIDHLDKDKNKTLMNQAIRFKGLCELICNRILMDNALGTDSLKDYVTVERMDEKKVKDSHVLDVYSIWDKSLAYLFKVYPHNVFSSGEQKKLIISSTINREVLSQGLQRIVNDDVLLAPMVK